MISESWYIVKQPKGDFCYVAKPVKMFPIIKNGERIGFGRFKYPMFKLIIQHSKERKEHVIIFSKKDGFVGINYKWPNGESTFYTSIENFAKEFRQRGIITNMVVSAMSHALQWSINANLSAVR